MKSDGTIRLPLSFNQELLCMFDSGDAVGPFGPRYHIVIGRRLAGPVDVATLRAALRDVVRRHEPLRTNIVRTGGAPYQEVFAPSAPHLEVRDEPGLAPCAREGRAEELLGELEAGFIAAEELPHLRAVLLRFDERDAVLALITHHTASDGWSMGIILRDLAACYVARRTGTAAELAPMRPYREFVAWERDRVAGAPGAQARQYWVETLRGAQLRALPADHPRSAGLPPRTATYRFDIDPRLLHGVRTLARSARCSPFMVLLGAYYQLVNQITGSTDIVVSTHTLGRPPGQFENTVGSFFNFVPLRVDVASCRDGRDLLRRVRTACVGAYEHEIPAVQVFAAAPDLMGLAMQDHLAPVTFQALPALPAPAGTTVGDLTYTVVPRREVSLAVTSDIPDGAVWSIPLDPVGAPSGNLTYRADRFDERTVIRLAADYQDTLRRLVAGAAEPAAERPPDAP